MVSKFVVSESGEVTGVNFIHSNKLHIVLVKKEVVLSAGMVDVLAIRSKGCILITY